MGLKRAQDVGAENHTNAKHYIIPFTITDGNGATGTIAIDTTNLDPSLANSVEAINTNIAGTLVTEQTWAGTGMNSNPAVFGIGLVDGLAKSVQGYGVILSNSGAGNAGVAAVAGITIGTIAGQATAGISTKGNVAILCTVVGTNPVMNAAAGTGKGVLHLIVG